MAWTRDEPMLKYLKFSCPMKNSISDTSSLPFLYVDRNEGELSPFPLPKEDGPSLLSECTLYFAEA